MKRIHIIFLSFTSVLFWQCGTQNDVASNYYNDGIYFDPAYGNILVEAATDVAEDTTFRSTSDDYYEPGTYTSPYESNTGLDYNAGVNSMYSPWGWNTTFSMGATWGTPYGYDYYPYYGTGFGYPGYYPGYGYGMGYNPYCPGYGGYPAYGYGGYPPYGGYPGYGYVPGNDFGGYWNSTNQPNVVITGNSGARGNRNNTGATNSKPTANIPLKGGKVANSTPNKPTENVLVTPKASKVREASLATTKPTSAINATNKSRASLYQRAAGTFTETTKVTNANRNAKSNSGTAQTSPLARQTNRIISPRSSNTTSRSSSSSSIFNSTNTRPGGSAPAINTGGGRSGGGGGARPASGGGGSRVGGGSTSTSGPRR